MPLLAALLGLASAAVVDESCATAGCRAERAATALVMQYQTLTDGQDEEKGLFGNTKPWIEANGIEALCDYVCLPACLCSVSVPACLTSMFLCAGAASWRPRCPLPGTAHSRADHAGEGV